MNQEPDIKKAAEAIAARKGLMRGKKFVVGFDGFVDEIIHAVAVRKNNHEFERIHTITEFAERVASAAGKSANIEFVPLVEKIGGNGPLMAMATAGMGCDVTLIGMIGYPDLHPVFSSLRNICRPIGVGVPGHTDAVEFTDGKLMLGKLNTIKDMNWKRLVEVIGEPGLRDLFFASDMVACTNWTMLTEMDEVLENIIRMVPSATKTKFFFDLADPEKRPRADLERVLGQIQSLSRGVELVLGLNLREAEQVGDVLGIKEKPIETPLGVEAAAIRIRDKMKLSGVVVHAIRCAGGSVGAETAGVAGPYCANPKLSTGAGDHFNGGFCGGLLAELPLNAALYAGVGASGWYVRNGRSPNVDDVVGLLQDWAAGTLQD